MKLDLAAIITASLRDFGAVRTAQLQAEVAFVCWSLETRRAIAAARKRGAPPAVVVVSSEEYIMLRTWADSIGMVDAVESLTFMGLPIELGESPTEGK